MQSPLKLRLFLLLQLLLWIAVLLVGWMVASIAF
jgi:hypothetical protein